MIAIYASYNPRRRDPHTSPEAYPSPCTTQARIIIAIPALIFHRYFRSRADNFLHRMEREASALNRIINRGAGR